MSIGDEYDQSTDLAPQPEGPSISLLANLGREEASEIKAYIERLLGEIDRLKQKVNFERSNAAIERAVKTYTAREQGARELAESLVENFSEMTARIIKEDYMRLWRERFGNV